MFRRHFLRIVLSKTLVFILVIHVAAGLVFAESETISTALKDYLDAAKGPRQFWVGCEPVHAGKDLVDFYTRRNFQPFWISDRGPSGAARELVAAVGQCGRHGLSPLDYHHSCLSEWLNALEAGRPTPFKAKDLAAMEIVLSDAFLNYGNHLANGKVDPASIYPQWLTEKKKEKIFEFLADIETPRDVREILEALAPSSHGYLTSLAEVRRLREIIASGGWPVIPPGKTLRKGDLSYRIPLLRKRLFLEGDLPGEGKDDLSCVFDANLEKGVFQFQIRHGLASDGAVGRRTLAALKRSPEDRLATVLVNLERWRWLPRDPGRCHIIINAAAFGLEAYRDGQRVLEMAVIVGEDYTMTPVFSKDMAYLVINPYWDVPPGVLARKILPKIKEDPGYLTANHFEVISGWKEGSTRVNPETIDWSNVHAGNFPGRLRQTPGPWNALGRIKFIFPNKFSIYLHDTPDRHLFQRTVRAFSSGCIRVEKPIELALYVLENDTSWNRSRVERTIKSGKTTVVPLQNPVTVHLLYRTFWVGPEGEANYREDIYGLDRVLWEALRSKPATALLRPGPARRILEADPNVEVRLAGKMGEGRGMEMRAGSNQAPTSSVQARHPRARIWSTTPRRLLRSVWPLCTAS